MALLGRREHPVAARHGTMSDGLLAAQGVHASQLYPGHSRLGAGKIALDGGEQTYDATRFT